MFKVIKQLVVVASADGKTGDFYGYEGALVPKGHNDERCEQLVKEGFLEKVSESEQAGEQDGPPAKSASKGDWEAYARSQGAGDEDLDGKSKADLIDAYGADQD